MITTKRILSLLTLLLLGLTCRGENSAERTMRDFRQIGLSSYQADDIRILPTAVEKFQALFSDVERAEKYILLDYFKFQQDSICGALLERLYEKARRGVDVRIIFDSFGNKSSDLPLSDTLVQQIREHGIRIQAFDPMRFPWINHLMHRNHHKIAVIDGKIVYTGGMNVADYYLHGKPKVGQWRDMHVRMTGPIVQPYEELFWKIWGDPSKSPLKGETCELKDSLPLREGRGGSKAVFFASRWPRETPRIMRQTYSACIDNADHLVQIVNPYAMLFGEVRAAIRRALERGVRVQFMVSTKSDGKANDDVIGLEMRKLMKRGAEVYYYNNGFHHSKVMMVDSLFCTVGTTNLDARSLSFDYEVNAFIFSPATTHELQRIFQQDIDRHCTLLTPEVFKERFPLRRRMRSRFFTIAKRFM
ncbi:MAG: cardiolipin synthase [Bacteroidaceae bacterium]|nr:cardiolipin synthase [Bacteroidaceae bacterium]MBQ8455713.1 cardiolipin synthase [Bacteroidaceae bacterium]MBQ9169747.1 cardiolipin synthase [Bacteroidaceae bacterium]MBQ9295011.1 cardiolipin synthase [Bacteroidaceae bacterium]